MRLTYIYHSGFVVEAEGFSILIDYFKDTDIRRAIERCKKLFPDKEG